MAGLDLHRNLQPVNESIGQYATTLFTEEALHIIEKHSVGSAQKPLFLVVSHLAAHTGKWGLELGVPNQTETNLKFHYITNKRRRNLAEISSIMDDSIGSIVESLQKYQMLKNSIVLYFSDNGAPTTGLYANGGSNWPLRGIKMTVWEGAVRGTGAIYSPLLKNTQYVYSSLFHLVDFLPTFLTAAGGEANVQTLPTIDGVSQWEALNIGGTTPPRDGLLVNIDEELDFSALIQGDYKLVKGTYSLGVYDRHFGESGRGHHEPAYIDIVRSSRVNRAIQQINKEQRPLTAEKIRELRRSVDLRINHNSSCIGQSSVSLHCHRRPCLFDIVKDPCESRDLSEDFPKVVVDLSERLNQYMEQLMPQRNQPVDLRANPIFHGNTWITWLDDNNLA